jgi:hypothetical protein
MYVDNTIVNTEIWGEYPRDNDLSSNAPVEVKSICGINKNKKLFEIYTFDHIWLPENLSKP